VSWLTAVRARLLGLFGRRPPPQRRAVARYAVACEARLDVDAGTYHVQVCDISQAGALLVLAEPLEPGARAQLRFPLLDGRPAAWCVVRHVSASEGRVGVEFQGDLEASADLAEQLVRRYGTSGVAAG
jgi:hypothetical protein